MIDRKLMDGLRLVGLFALAVAISAAGGFLAGRLDMTAEYERKAAKAQVAAVTHAARIDVAAAGIAADVTVMAAKAQADIVVKTQILKEKVPVYVPYQVDRNVIVPVGAVLLHNAAAGLSELPETAGESAARPSGIGIAEFTGVVVGNYGKCHALEANYQALWDHDQQQYELHKGDQ